MSRKSVVFKQIVIPYTVLFIPIVMDYVIKRLSKNAFSILAIYKVINFIMYLVCGILISELIRISLKYQDRLSTMVIVFNVIALLLIYRFIPLEFLNNQSLNILLIGCHIYVAIYIIQKRRE